MPPKINDAGIIEDDKHAMSSLPAEYDNSTRAIHADDILNSSTDVAPALHVSTTFRYASNPDELLAASDVTVCSLHQFSTVPSNVAPITYRFSPPL